ncbi:MAG TPA: hypothetical protein VGQ20_17330, partial [Acidimicrobiales bacterium]|nr:hypothetical protein [Acidimicrobiales bacterium]
DLATRGLPVVPTTWLEPGDLVRIPDRGEIVVQPVVYGGTIDEMRYRLPDHGEQARTQIEALLRDGRPVMVQPFLAEGGDHRDVRLVYIDGMLSHAVRPGPTTAAATAPASDVERAVGDRAIAVAADVGGPSLYAQVCLVGGIRGEPLVAELQLVAPKLYLSAAVGAPERFADAIARWADV